MARRRRFRRTRRVGIACALLALLLVGGPGLGVPTPGAARGASDAASEDAPRREKSVGPGRASTDGDSAADPPPGPQTRDFVFGALASARLASDRGELSVAMRLLDAVDSSLRHADLAPAIEATSASVRAALAEVGSLLAADFAAGRALRAAGRVEKLLVDLHPRVADALDQEWARRGWPARLSALPDVELPDARPLADRRTVRLSFEAQWCQGTIVGEPAAGGDSTVRIETAGGVVFPSVPRAALEPVEPTADEVVAQVRACLRAGRAAAVWAWWTLAHIRGQPLDPELARHLASGR